MKAQGESVRARAEVERGRDNEMNRKRITFVTQLKIKSCIFGGVVRTGRQRVFVWVIIHYVVMKMAFNLSRRRLHCAILEIRYCAQEIHFAV